MEEPYGTASNDDPRAAIIRLERGGSFVGFSGDYDARVGDHIAVQIVEQDDATMARALLSPAEAERVARWLVRAATDLRRA